MTWRGDRVRVTAVGILLLPALAACTPEAAPRPSAGQSPALGRLDIAVVPAGATRVTRDDLHEEVDPLLGPRRRTAFVLSYSTRATPRLVARYYRSTYGDRWSFDPVDTEHEAGWTMTARRSDLVAEIRAVRLVHPSKPQWEPRGTRGLESDVTVVVSRRSSSTRP